MTPRITTGEIYAEKAFNNAKRCLREAKQTNHEYQHYYCSLINPNSGLHERVMLPQYAIPWLIDVHLPNWSSNTWRLLRCSYRYLLEHLLQSSLIDKKTVEDLFVAMLDAKAIKQEVRRTSGMRRKSITEKSYNILLEECESECTSRSSIGNNKYTWGTALKLFLISSVATGLRPNEWKTAEIIELDNKFVLKCENFKHNESRSYATHREIDLSAISEDKKVAIKAHNRLVQGCVQNGIDHYKYCRTLLRRLNTKLWPNHKTKITLYTGRHQFSANAKASPSTSDKERAAMMGHKTTKTSSERYGRKKSGKNGLTPKIADEKVLLLIKKPLIDRQYKFTPEGPRNSPKNNR
jgi:integrase